MKRIIYYVVDNLCFETAEAAWNYYDECHADDDTYEHSSVKKPEMKTIIFSDDKYLNKKKNNE